MLKERKIFELDGDVCGENVVAECSEHSHVDTEILGDMHGGFVASEDEEIGLPYLDAEIL